MVDIFKKVILQFIFDDFEKLPDSLKKNFDLHLNYSMGKGRIDTYRIMRNELETCVGEITRRLLPDDPLLSRFDEADGEDDSDLYEELSEQEENPVFWLQAFKDLGCKQVEVSIQYLCTKSRPTEHGIYWEAARFHNGVIERTDYADRYQNFKPIES